MLLAEDGALVLHDARTASSRRVAAAQAVGASAPSPSGRFLALSLRADSSRLAVLDVDAGTLQPVHATADSVVYSVAWHPKDDTLAYGFYVPTREGNRGAGDIRLATGAGPLRTVGCRAAREVVDWLPGATLAVRDDAALYHVSASDCATQATLDVRRKHHLAFAAGGAHLAFIYRDLRYVRDERAYVPDSSLRVSGPRGQGERTLFGDERAVRHLRWAPAAPELAFDLVPEGETHRRIVTYNAAQERTAFLVPPQQAAPVDQVMPRWSPSGSYVAFVQRRPGGSVAAVRTAGQTRTLGATTHAVQWVTDQRLVVPGPDSLRVTSRQGAAVYAVPSGATLVHAWSRPSV
jgi:hypothetical protein